MSETRKRGSIVIAKYYPEGCIVDNVLSSNYILFLQSSSTKGLRLERRSFAYIFQVVAYPSHHYMLFNLKVSPILKEKFNIFQNLTTDFLYCSWCKSLDFLLFIFIIIIV